MRGLTCLNLDLQVMILNSFLNLIVWETDAGPK